MKTLYNLSYSLYKFKTSIKHLQLLSLVLILLLSSPVQLLAQAKQSTRRIYKWEGITYNNDRVFGVARSYKQAKVHIDQYTTQNLNTRDRLIYQRAKRVGVKCNSKQAYLEVFEAQFSEAYFVLSPSEYNAIRIYQESGFFKACTYYSKAEGIRYAASQNHLEHLILTNCPYILNFKINKKGKRF